MLPMIYSATRAPGDLSRPRPRKGSAVPREALRRAVSALGYLAHIEAAHTQAPNLIAKETTQAWKDARRIEQYLKATRR